LSQRELGRLVGYGDEGEVPKHETSRALPTLLMAISYGVIFRMPVAEMFPGVHESIAQAVEQRLAELERKLRQQVGKGRRMSINARKLQWFEERRAKAYSHR
jgi:hypothetical protein